MMMSDAEIGALHREGRIAEWQAAIEAQAEATAPRVAAPAAVHDSVSRAQLMAALKHMATNIALELSKREGPRLAHIARLEKRLAALEAKPSGPVIHAASVQAEGLGALADAVAELRATLAAPVRPIYDERGKLVGAERAR